jgi:hypothetical protein
MHRRDHMDFGDFLRKLRELEDDAARWHWVQSLPAGDRKRMLNQFILFHEALNGDIRAQRKVARLARSENRKRGR